MPVLRYYSISCVGVLLYTTILGLGCRVHIGANHLFLVTRMNSGFDADTLPPVVELSLFSRFDGVHAPSFEEAQTIPVVTSFRRGGGPSSGGWLYSGALFAAGAPALAIASLGLDVGNPTKEEFDSAAQTWEELTEIELSAPPTFDDANKNLFGPGEAPPLWFGTSESIGLEFEFYGPSVPPFLQSVHVGFRRKEFLIAPLGLSKRDDGSKRPYVVHTPSVLAIVNAVPSDAAASGRDCGCGKRSRRCRRKPGRIHLFATGKAAVRIAAQKGVRKEFLRGLVEQDEQKSED